MYLLLTLSQFNEQNVQYIENEKEIYNDEPFYQYYNKFCKIVYSTSYFNCNALYLKIPLLWNSNPNDSSIITFQPQYNNMQILEQLHEIEHAILTTYSTILTQEKYVKSIKYQLINDGYIKLTSYTPTTTTTTTQNKNYKYAKKNKTLYIKINGIWEKDEYVGLSYRFYMSYSS